MKYFQNQKYTIYDSKLICDGALFSGKGFMRWNPTKGFDIDLMVESDNYKRPKVQKFGEQKIIKRKERQRIQLYIEGFKNAFIPSAYLGPRLSLLLNRTLSFKAHHLIFLQNTPEKETSFWSGSGILKLSESNFIFENDLYKQEKIDDSLIYEGWARNGVLYENEKFKLIGWVEENKYFYFQYRLHKEFYSQKFALKYVCGLQNALTFLVGSEVKRLKHELFGRNSIVTEVNKESDARYMRLYEGLKTFQTVDSKLFGDLSLFFTKGFVDSSKFKESFVSQNIIIQLSEADQQKTYAARELLTATILEAALRSLYNQPFVEGKKGSFNVSNYLKNNFIPDYVDGKEWRKVRKTVIKAFKRVRHRNAHPDWLILEKDLYNDDHISKTYHDLRKLIKFYQQMILLMADVKNVEPKLPTKI